MNGFTANLPKAELHIHIEGSFEPELKFKIAKRNNIELPYKTIEDCKASYKFHDLPSFLKVYYEGMSVLLTEEDFYDLTYSYLTKAHSQNVLYSEMFFDPQPHLSRGIEFKTIINGITKARKDALTKLGIESNLILCFLRDLSQESAIKTLDLALPYADHLIGVGLDSDEKGNPPIKFKEVFTRARSNGLKLTMHCDVNQDNSIEHIWQCLNKIKVDRLDHGLNCIDNEDLCKEVIAKNITLTICPISNAHITGDTGADKIRTMLTKGIKATINSDDPAYFRGYINENYQTIFQEANYSQEMLKQLAINSFAGSWLNEDKKQIYINQVTQY